jgi:hypothetical protein
MVLKFCEKTPQYHYKEVPVYPSYASNSRDAMEVLKKCAESMETGIVGVGSPLKKQGWVVGMIGVPANLNFDIEAKTLELAICLFAKKLFFR